LDYVFTHSVAAQRSRAAAFDVNRDKSVTASPEAQPTPSSGREFERSLVNALVSGEGSAVTRFLDHMSTMLWSIVAKLEGGGANEEAAFLHVVTSLAAERLNHELQSLLADDRAEWGETRSLLCGRLARNMSEGLAHACL
jgi:hypothetical protein